MKLMGTDFTYQELRDFYATTFSLGDINGSIDNKFALISLVCFLTQQAKKQNPDANCYKVLMKVTEGFRYPEKLIKGLSVVCEDFMYNCEEFNKCGCKSANEMVTQINTILANWLPF